MIKLYDEELTGYIEAEVEDFYCNDFPHFFVRIDKNSYVRWLYEPIYNVPEMITCNRPADGGHLIIEAADYEDFITREPNAKKYIKRLIGSKEFIHNLPRYCLWLKDCLPNEIRKMPLVYQRVEAVKNFRLANKRADTRKLASTLWLFGYIS
ncbi:MAG: hypothetical protein IJK81_11570 [Selenomonadaceae bacterium]|nr:hypothetical protein [Selenomonadaceae bacterium]